MQIKGYTGGDKFSGGETEAVKISSEGNGHDPSETISPQGIDDIWNDNHLADDVSTEPKPNGKDDSEIALQAASKVDGTTAKADQAELEKIKEKILEAIAADGRKLQIPSGSKLPVTIRGEESQVTVQDLINNYSGDKDFHNLYNNLNRERQIFDNQRKKFQASEETWNKFSKSISERITSGKPELIMDAWEDLISKTGVDPSQFSHHLVKALMPTIQKYSQMSPEEQKLYDMQVELDARARSLERFEKNQKASMAEREQNEFVERITKEVTDKNEAYGFSMEDFDNGFKKLQDLQNKGHYQGDIEPDNVFALLFKERVETKAQDLLKDSAPELSKDKGKAADFVKYVLKHVMTDFWSKDMQNAEYYEGLAKDYLAKISATEVSRKVAANKPSPDVIVKKRPGKNASTKGPLKTTREVSSEDLSFLKNGHIQW